MGFCYINGENHFPPLHLIFSFPVSFVLWSSVYHQPLRVDHNRGRAVCMRYQLLFILYVALMSQLAQEKPIKQHSRQQLCPRDTLVTSLEDCPWDTIRSVTLGHPELLGCL